MNNDITAVKGDVAATRQVAENSAVKINETKITVDAVRQDQDRANQSIDDVASHYDYLEGVCTFEGNT